MKTRGWVLAAAAALAMAGGAFAQEKTQPKGPGGFDPVRLVEDARKPENVSTTLEIVLLFTVLSLAPAILVMTTSFTRIVIVLSFVRKAVGTQESPPNQVLTGLALLLTFMVMAPTFGAVKREALDPYTSKEKSKQISGAQALERAEAHLRVFMFKQVRDRDVLLFMDITRQARKEGQVREADVPTEVLVPAFVLSELRRAFIMGFALFLPFVIIDMIVSATLVTMGMLVLPPMFISLPFKILLFILVDGWHLVVGSLVQSFYA